MENVTTTINKTSIAPLLEKNKKKISLIVGVIFIVFFAFYIIKGVTEEVKTARTNASSKDSILSEVSKDFILFLVLTQKDKISFEDASFKESYFYRNAVDYTQLIRQSASRGRPDPFIPYAITGSTR